MPTLQLKLAPPVSESVQAALAQELTQLGARLLGKREEVTAVMVETLASGRWHIGGRAATEPTAWLEISITAGTNTEAQKAAFINAAHTALQRHLAAGQVLAEASYVIVRELPATDWGYAGRTQRARQQARDTAVVL
jgi:4-oxalocrotonate tautomerase